MTVTHCIRSLFIISFFLLVAGCDEQPPALANGFDSLDLREGCGVQNCVCSSADENLIVTECDVGFACTYNIRHFGIKLCEPIVDATTCSENENRVYNGARDCGDCLPGWTERTGQGCVPVPNCMAGVPGSLLEQCAGRNRDCVPYDGGAVCGACTAGYGESDALGDEAVCELLKTCETLNCHDEGRVCNELAAQISCGGCLPGWAEDADGACIQDECGSAHNPNSLRATCAQRGRDCDNSADGAVCGNCAYGFSDDDDSDESGLVSCHALETCDTAGCSAQGRMCIDGDLDADDRPISDATCGDCLPGSVARAGTCQPTTANCEADEADGSILAACEALGRRCESDGQTARCTAICTPDQIEECGDVACEAGECGCGVNQVEENGACRAPLTCDQLEGREGACEEDCLDLSGFGLDARCQRCDGEVGSGRDERIWVAELTQCVECPSCEGAGVAGPFPEPTSAGWCICRTADDYFFSTAGDVGALPCDADGDGWIRESARRAMESDDPTLRRNARCTLRHIEAIEYVNEAGRSIVKPLPAPVPMYESDRNDDDAILAVLWTRAGLSQALLTPGALDAKALNRFTRVCSDARADFNDNGWPDVSDGQGLPPAPGFREDQHIFNQNSYFLELHTGAFEPTNGDLGKWVITERRRDPADPAALPISYTFGQDAHGNTDYYRSCDRRQDTSYSPGGPSLNLDFAGLTEDRRGFMKHHSQFKCVDVGRGTEPDDDRYEFNTCEVLAGAEGEGSNARSPGFDCSVDANDSNSNGVRWAAVKYQKYPSSPDHAGYTFGCVNACSDDRAAAGDSVDEANRIDEADVYTCRDRFAEGYPDLALPETLCTDGAFGQLRCLEIPCDGADNDADGETDGDFAGSACQTGLSGVCSAGTWQACDEETGTSDCEGLAPSDEVCDGEDNDCDGIVDEEAGWPVGSRCMLADPNANQDGECANRVIACVDGETTCVGANGDGEPTREICDGSDNDCDGEIDEVKDLRGRPIVEAPDGEEAQAVERFGQVCQADGPPVGACRQTVWQCQGGQPACLSNVVPLREGCDSGPNNRSEGDWLEVSRLCSRTADDYGVVPGDVFRHVCPTHCEPNTVWGIGPYTSDSAICSAAVHAGLITAEGGGKVAISLSGPIPAGAGSTEHGITSRAHGGAWHGSFSFVEWVSGAPDVCEGCPADLTIDNIIDDPDRWGHCRCDGIDNDCDGVADENGACRRRVRGLSTRFVDNGVPYTGQYEVDLTFSGVGSNTGAMVTRRGWDDDEADSEAAFTLGMGTVREYRTENWSLTMPALPANDRERRQCADPLDISANQCVGDSDADGQWGCGRQPGQPVPPTSTITCRVKYDRLLLDIFPPAVFCDGIGTPEVCDGRDNDCDGDVDEYSEDDPLANPEIGEPCLDANTSLLEGDMGVEEACRPTFQCNGGRIICATPEEPLNGPEGAFLSRRPRIEQCNNKDDDCDGEIDEGYYDCPNGTPCGPGLQRCHAGELVGACEAPCDTGCGPGWARCDEEEGAAGNVGQGEDGAARAFSETCHAGKDRTAEAIPNVRRDALENLGVCAQDLTCTGEPRRWRTPAERATGYEIEEVTCDGQDNDCDGRIDEGRDLADCEVHYQPTGDELRWATPAALSACLCPAADPVDDEYRSYTKDRTIHNEYVPGNTGAREHCVNHGVGRLIREDEYRDLTQAERQGLLGRSLAAVDGAHYCPDGVANLDPYSGRSIDCGNRRAARQIICVNRCGDGLLAEAAGEECDDGNRATGDGCNPSCIIDGTPPVLLGADVYRTADAGIVRIGVHVSGTDSEGDARKVRVTLRDANNLVVVVDEGLQRFEGPLDLDWAGQAFEGTVSFEFQENPARPATHATIQVIDSVDLPSQTLDRVLVVPPRVAQGATCDPTGALNACMRGTVCSDAFGDSACVASRAPVINSTRAVLDGRILAVRIEGSDADGDASNARFQVFIEGNPPTEVFTAPDVVGDDTDFVALFAWRVPLEFDVETLRSIRMQVVDELGSQSRWETMNIEPANANVDVSVEGEDCFPTGVMGPCAPGQHCDVGLGPDDPGDGYAALGACRAVIQPTLCSAGAWLDQQTGDVALELVHVVGEFKPEDAVELVAFNAEGVPRSYYPGYRLERIELLEALRPVNDYVPDHADLMIDRWVAPGDACDGADGLQRSVVFFRLLPEHLNTRMGVDVQLVDLAEGRSPDPAARLIFDRRRAAQDPDDLAEGDVWAEDSRALALGEACFETDSKTIFGTCPRPLICDRPPEESISRCRPAATQGTTDCVGDPSRGVDGMGLERWQSRRRSEGSCGNAGEPMVWRYQADEAGKYDFEASGTNPVLRLHWACEARLDTELRCNDDIAAGANLNSQVLRVPLAQGDVVYVYVHETDGQDAAGINLEVSRVAD